MAMANEAVKPIGTSLAEIIRASGRSPREQAGQTTVLTKRRKKRQKMSCNAGAIHRGRDLAAWLGLTPLNKSSGGKERLGRITKKGDHYIRKLLIVGMTSRALMAKLHPEKVDIWTARMLAGKPFRLATVAMANKSARVIWVMLTRQENYRQPVA